MILDSEEQRTILLRLVEASSIQGQLGEIREFVKRVDQEIVQPLKDAKITQESDK